MMLFFNVLDFQATRLSTQLNNHFLILVSIITALLTNMKFGPFGSLLSFLCYVYSKDKTTESYAYRRNGPAKPASR